MNISSKELKKMARNQLSGKYGTFIGTNVLYILITLVASNLMDLVLGTSSILNPLTATSATVETLGISHTVVYYLSTFILSLILSVLNPFPRFGGRVIRCSSSCQEPGFGC